MGRYYIVPSDYVDIIKWNSRFPSYKPFAHSQQFKSKRAKRPLWIFEKDFHVDKHHIGMDLQPCQIK